MALKELIPFYVTFGQQYGREKHPTVPHATKDTVVKIMATDKDQARMIALGIIGLHRSMIYEPNASRSIFEKDKSILVIDGFEYEIIHTFGIQDFLSAD